MVKFFLQKSFVNSKSNPVESMNCILKCMKLQVMRAYLNCGSHPGQTTNCNNAPVKCNSLINCKHAIGWWDSYIFDGVSRIPRPTLLSFAIHAYSLQFNPTSGPALRPQPFYLLLILM